MSRRTLFGSSHLQARGERAMRFHIRFPRLFVVITVATASPLAAQGRGAAQGDQGGGGRATWDVMQARGQTRDIDFTTSEGTWMSADLSSDGSWIVFDLLGHIYR